MKLVAHPETSPYQQGLDRNAANYAPLLTAQLSRAGGGRVSGPAGRHPRILPR